MVDPKNSLLAVTAGLGEVPDLNLLEGMTAVPLVGLYRPAVVLLQNPPGKHG